MHSALDWNKVECLQAQIACCLRMTALCKFFVRRKQMMQPVLKSTCKFCQHWNLKTRHILGNFMGNNLLFSCYSFQLRTFSYFLYVNKFVFKTLMAVHIPFFSKITRVCVTDASKRYQTTNLCMAIVEFWTLSNSELSSHLKIYICDCPALVINVEMWSRSSQFKLFHQLMSSSSPASLLTP